MIPEAVLSRKCYGQTLSRARGIAKDDSLIHNRCCTYKTKHTVLTARVDSRSDYSTYSVRVNINEENGTILDHECTCPAHRKYYGMCKHTAALVLLFNEQPETFKGNNTRPTFTSPSIASFMKRIDEAPPIPKRGSNQQPGTVSLELSLEPQDRERWAAVFRIATPEASYVVKDLSDLLRDIRSNAWREYGKKLAITHSKEMFTQQAWQVVQWMQRVTSGGSECWRKEYWSYPSTHRVLYVTTPQLIELLDLYLGRRVSMTLHDPRTGKKLKPAVLEVVEEDPQLDMAIVPLENGGYQLTRREDMGFVVFDDRLYAWDTQRIYRCGPSISACGAFLKEVYLSADSRLTVSEEDARLFCKTVLPLLQDALEVEAPPELEAMKPVEGRLEFYLDTNRGGAECRARALYGDAEYNLLVPGNQHGKPTRNESLEGGAREALLRYLPFVDGETGLALTETDEDMADLLFHGVEELRSWGEVFTTDAFDRRRANRRPSVQTGLSVESNLINLSIGADDMSAAEIASLLQSYQAKKRYHKLRDGSFVSLEDAADTQDLERLGAIASELGISSKELASGEVELAPYHAFLLDSLATEEEKEESFRQFVSTFADGRGQHHELPESLKGVMRPYQAEGYDWLCTLGDTGLAGILADEMGLGKSLQVISLLLSRSEELDEAPALVVCPASLVYNWLAEFRKFAPEMRVAALAGPKAQRAEVREQGGFQVLVTSYDTLRIDIEALQEMRFSYQVIDEAQFIKNHNTKAARAVKVIDAGRRLALTGTPIENRLSELWSIFDYLMPGMLGPYQRFRERYEAPILAGDEEVSARLGAKVGPFIMRRLKSDVLKDLPDKLETVVHAKLEGEQLKLYNAHETRLRLALTEEDDDSLKEGKIAILAELTKLRQLCCDPRLLYTNTKKRGAKLGAIAELVQAAQDSGQKVLVFSQFTSFLELIAAELSSRGWDYYTITGATPKKRRLELVDRFNSNDVPVFLISLKAGGTGLNLTGASVVIHADPWWNAAAQNQATDRAHRIGQTRDVSVFKVIADGTIEERILQLQEAKSNLADAVLAADSSSLAQLTREELISLLSE